VTYPTESVLAIRETAISWMRHGLSSYPTAMRMTGHAWHGFGRMDAEPSPTARVLLLCGMPSPTRRRHTVVPGTVAPIQAVERSAVSGAAGVWGGAVGLGVCVGIPARAGPQEHGGSGGNTGMSSGLSRARDLTLPATFMISFYWYAHA
jgi:hypothetical protein